MSNLVCLYFTLVKVVSYLLVSKLRRWPLKVQTWNNLCSWPVVHINKDLFSTCAFPII